MATYAQNPPKRDHFIPAERGHPSLWVWEMAANNKEKKEKKKRRVFKMRSLFELACCEGDRRPRNPNPPAAPGVWPSDGDAVGTRGSGGCGASRQPDLPSPLGIVASQQQNFLTCFDVSTTLYRSYVVYANMLVVHTS